MAPQGQGVIFHETASQGRGFLLLMCAGLLSGALYDLCALFRRRAPRWVGDVLDALWGAAAWALCLAALALSGESRVRLYAPLGLLCGGGIYGAGIHSLFSSLGRAIKKRRSKSDD